jgi:SAM-dependent methyltransferase
MPTKKITRRGLLSAGALVAGGCGTAGPEARSKAGSPPGEAAPRAKTERFADRVLGDMAGAALASLSYMGDRLGIFRALSGAGPLTSQELARRTGLNPRYMRSWLESMTAAGYVEYDPAAKTFLLPPEHAAVIADEESPTFLGGALQGLVPLAMVTPKVMDAFRSGKGVAYSEYPPDWFESMARWSAPGYKHQLAREWIPTMREVHRRLIAGAAAADIGCGQGLASIMLAKAFPKSRFWGYDAHAPSIERARARAKENGVEDRVTFETADGARIPRRGFDLITSFDVLHDAADPAAIVRSARQALAPGGSYLASEPGFSPRLEENINLWGRIFYPATFLYCMSVSLGQGGAGIGSDIGEEMARGWGRAAGFTRIQRLPISGGMFLEMTF